MEVHEAPAAERRVGPRRAPLPDAGLLGPRRRPAALLQAHVRNNCGVAEDAVARLDDRGGTRGFAACLQLEIVLMEGLCRTDTVAKPSRRQRQN